MAGYYMAMLGYNEASAVAYTKSLRSYCEGVLGPDKGQRFVNQISTVLLKARTSKGRQELYTSKASVKGEKEKRKVVYTLLGTPEDAPIVARESSLLFHEAHQPSRKEPEAGAGVSQVVSANETGKRAADSSYSELQPSKKSKYPGANDALARLLRFDAPQQPIYH